MPWMQTNSGKAFDLLNPDPATVDLDDICFALSNINRFTGHAARPWSVAQHSILVLWLFTHDTLQLNEWLSPHIRLALLTHDFAEAYTGDISQPMKLALREAELGPEGLGLPALTRIEHKITEAINSALGLPEPSPETLKVVKHYDLLALNIERSSLLGSAPQLWAPLPQPKPFHFEIFKDLLGSKPDWQRSTIRTKVGDLVALVASLGSGAK